MRFSSTAYATLSFVHGLNFPRVLFLFTSIDGSRVTVCVAQMVKNLLADAGDTVSILGSGRSSGEGNGNPLQCSCLEIHGQRSLAGCSSQDHKELDTTEQLTLHFLIFQGNN